MFQWLNCVAKVRANVLLSAGDWVFKSPKAIRNAIGNQPWISLSPRATMMLAVAVWVTSLVSYSAGQESKPRADATETADAREASTTQAPRPNVKNSDRSISVSLIDLHGQIDKLNDPAYRVRERARWKLAQHPVLALQAIRSRIGEIDRNAGAHLVDLLTEFAINQDASISFEAFELLEETAERMSSVGQLAENSLQAIADLHEQQALEILDYHSAIIGPRRFSLNGQLGVVNEMALHINDTFTGDEEVLQWVKYLTSIETVCLEGSKISRRHIEAVVQMKGLRNLKLKSMRLAPGDLVRLKSVGELDHLGLLYVNIADADIDTILTLPISDSVKISGSMVSKAGAERLIAQLDDLEVYCGRGGFLGVGPVHPSGTVVERISPDSAASAAGIRRGDVLMEVNSVPVKTFLDLREELAKYPAGATIQIKLMRGENESVVEATLKEET